MPHPNRTSPPATVGGGAEATANTSTTDATTGVSTGMSWAVTPGAYMLAAHLNHTTDVSTTSAGFAMVRSGGCTLSYGSIHALLVIGGTGNESANVISNADGFAQGQTGSAATERPISVTGQFIVTAAGRLTLFVRSEVGGSAVTITRGCGTLTRIR